MCCWRETQLNGERLWQKVRRKAAGITAEEYRRVYGGRGITAYPDIGGTLEMASQTVAHAFIRTTQLYKGEEPRYA